VIDETQSAVELLLLCMPLTGVVLVALPTALARIPVSLIGRHREIRRRVAAIL
jgi:hypothetical protein